MHHLYYIRGDNSWSCFVLGRFRWGVLADAARLCPQGLPFSLARHGRLPSMPRPPSPARGTHVPAVQLGGLQPAGPHVRDLQGATNGRPDAVLF